jgi:hypothetical protein
LIAFRDDPGVFGSLFPAFSEIFLFGAPFNTSKMQWDLSIHLVALTASLFATAKRSTFPSEIRRSIH